MIVETKKVLITGVKEKTLESGTKVKKVYVREPDGHMTSFIDGNTDHEYKIGRANLILSFKQSKDFSWNASLIGYKPEDTEVE